MLLFVIGSGVLLYAKSNRDMNKKARVFLGLIGLFTALIAFCQPLTLAKDECQCNR